MRLDVGQLLAKIWTSLSTGGHVVSFLCVFLVLLSKLVRYMAYCSAPSVPPFACAVYAGKQARRMILKNRFDPNIVDWLCFSWVKPVDAFKYTLLSLALELPLSELGWREVPFQSYMKQIPPIDSWRHVYWGRRNFHLLMPALNLVSLLEW